jgi:hypothetical protein
MPKHNAKRHAAMHGRAVAGPTPRTLLPTPGASCITQGASGEVIYGRPCLLRPPQGRRRLELTAPRQRPLDCTSIVLRLASVQAASVHSMPICGV